MSSFGYQQQGQPPPGFQQLTDAHNPAAQAYARQVLATNGIHVPAGVDAAAIWRQFSQRRAMLQNAARLQGGGEAPDFGVRPGASAGPPPMAQQSLPQVNPGIGPGGLPLAGPLAQGVGQGLLQPPSGFGQLPRRQLPRQLVRRGGMGLPGLRGRLRAAVLAGRGRT